jgi:hypothetical protein
MIISFVHAQALHLTASLCLAHDGNEPLESPFIIVCIGALPLTLRISYSVLLHVVALSIAQGFRVGICRH